jgi:translation initiation factor 2 subunit 1
METEKDTTEQPENIHHEEIAINLESRFYKDKLPQEGEFVKVFIKDVTDSLITIVNLLEYNDIEGIITPNEFSRMPRVKNMLKLRKNGKMEICMVIRVDSEGGYIDLSKKRVTPDDAKAAENRYSYSKTVQSLLRTVAEHCRIDMEVLMAKIVWPLQEQYKHHHVLEAFHNALSDFDEVFGSLNLEKNIKTKLESEIKRRLSPQPVKIRADFELTCFEVEGIEGIRAALMAGEALSTEEIPIKVNLIAPPNYVIMTTTLKRKESMTLLENALEMIKKTIVEKRGKFELKTAPKIIGQQHDRELEMKLKELEQDNEPSDDDEDEEVEGMGQTTDFDQELDALIAKKDCSIGEQK